MFGRNFNIQTYNRSEYECVSWSCALVTAMCGAGQEEGFIFNGEKVQRK